MVTIAAIGREITRATRDLMKKETTMKTRVMMMMKKTTTRKSRHRHLSLREKRASIKSREMSRVSNDVVDQMK